MLNQKYLKKIKKKKTKIKVGPTGHAYNEGFLQQIKPVNDSIAFKDKDVNKMKSYR